MVRIDNIAQLPLFTGLSLHELEDITSQCHFDSHHHKKGQKFIEEYQQVNSLIFLTHGWTDIHTSADNHAYTMVERAEKGLMIEPEKLFGLTTHYHSSYVAVTPCDTLALSKEHLMDILTKYIIVRLNFLNAISRTAQHYQAAPWQETHSDAKESIKKFIRQHCALPYGRKTLYITMQQLADELHFSRIDISQALHQLQDEEKIISRRGFIEVPALQLLN